MKNSFKKLICLLMAVAFAVIPAGKIRAEDLSNEILLRYDDRYDVSGKTVEIVKAGESVVSLKENHLAATGIGTAKVRIDGVLYEVTVEKAKVHIVTIMGQSNAGNHFENATSDVTCAPGTAYWWGNGKGTNAAEPVDYTSPSMGFHTPLVAELYAQSVANGDPVKPVMVWQEGITSKNGQSIVKWAASETDTSGTDATAQMIKNCVAYYEQNSDKYEIVGNGIYWLQGESDTAMEPEKYTKLYMAMWSKLKEAGAEYVAFFRVRRSVYESDGNNEGLAYHGSLNAQLQMVNNNADMFMATTITENWTGNASTEHSIDISNYITLMEEYGKEESHNDSYGNAATFKDGILTTTMKTLYGSNNKCHYGKFGYGIIGADAAFNMTKAFSTSDFAIVKADTSGKPENQQIFKAGEKTEIDITDMTENLAFRADCGSAAGTLEIKVTSGNTDITSKVIAKGINTYGTVDTEILRDYEDVKINVTYNPVNGNSGSVEFKIVDSTPDISETYIWDFENDLHARNEKGEVVNSFGETALNGSYVLEDGMLKASGLHLALEDAIRLSERKDWSIEWKFGEITENSKGFLFSSENRNIIGNKAFYHVSHGQFMISYYADSKGYRNYTLEEVTVKTGDVIKVTNRFDTEKGRSVLSLWQNGKLVIEDFQLKGSLNGFTSDLDMTQYPLSGDFTIRYMGSGTFLPVTDEFDYIKIVTDEGQEKLWLPVPLSTEETSDHLYYKIENGVLTFKDTGDSSLDDYGILPDYSNKSRDNPTDYAITEWFQRKSEITKVVFEESISYIGSYVLTNMDKVTEIVIENPVAETSKNAVLFSTKNRTEPLNIFAASTLKTVDYWIRGNGNRKITEAISEPTMYFTDFGEHTENLLKLEEALINNSEIEPELFYDTLILLKNVLSAEEYKLSDYRKAIPGAENIIELLEKELSGKCGDNLEYKIAADPEMEKLELIITGTGDMYEYENTESAPWGRLCSYIRFVSVPDSVTSISENAFGKNSIFKVSVNSFAYSFVKEKGFDYKIEKLRILLIGNSHTADYSQFLPNIIADMKNAGLETEISITKSSIGLYSGRNSNPNAAYRSHLEAIKNQSGAYSNLAGSRFDLIIVQDYMESVVDKPETFKAGISRFIEAIKTVALENGKGEPEIAWFADWVDRRSCGEDTSLRDGEGNKISLERRTREEVFENSLATINAVETAIEKGEENMPDFVIRGSAIKQNGMSSYFGTTVNHNENFCLLERDNTHLTYELGRYLLGSGVMAALSEYYGSAFTADEKSIDVPSSLTLENKPEAAGEGSQYSGEMTEETLAVVREAAGNFDNFVPSEYTVDPLDKALVMLKNRKWDISGINDETSAENSLSKQISDILGKDFKIISAETTDFVSYGNFDISIVIQYGYSIKQTVIEIRNYPFADLNLDGAVDVKDVYTARLISAKLLFPTEEQIALGDVDLDGKITAIDANIIRKYLAGIIESLPVQ